MILRRYFPNFVDVDESEITEHPLKTKEEAFQIPWVKEKMDAGNDVYIDGYYLMDRFAEPVEKFVIGIFLADDKKDYAP